MKILLLELKVSLFKQTCMADKRMDHECMNDSIYLPECLCPLLKSVNPKGSKHTAIPATNVFFSLFIISPQTHAFERTTSLKLQSLVSPRLLEVVSFIIFYL